MHDFAQQLYSAFCNQLVMDPSKQGVSNWKSSTYRVCYETKYFLIVFILYFNWLSYMILEIRAV